MSDDSRNALIQVFVSCCPQHEPVLDAFVRGIFGDYVRAPEA